MKRFFFLAIPLFLLAACRNDTYEYHPAGDRIRTVWAEQVGPANAHPEFPRPQMVRGPWESLNGLWDYAVTGKEDPQPTVPDGKILVPFCIESSLSGVGRSVTAEEALWYRTTFRVPRKWRKQHLLLHFDAVDWQTEVWVNGRHVGRHSGGYTAFSFDVTPYLTGRGPQELVLKVLDGTDNGEQPRGKQVMEPGGIWYTPVTGIWQSVWMEPVAEYHIEDYTVLPDIDAGCLAVRVFTKSEPGDGVEVKLTEGAVGYDTSGGVGKVIASGFGHTTRLGGEVVLSVEKPEYWSPEHPYLYGLVMTLFRDGKAVDEVHGYTAFRKSSEVRDGDGIRRIGLNNAPYFEFGPLDQGWWPDGLYTAPTDAALKYDIQKTKDFGYNMIRKHIKVEPARWYYYCDRIGLTVWQDMPSIADNQAGKWGEWGYDQGGDYPLSATAKTTYYKEWGEILRQLSKYPCIVVWVPFNEAWGQFDTEDVVAFTRSIDPTRLVNSASGGNSYHCGDILDSHNYPDPKMKFRSGGSQIDVLGEYGGIGWPVEGHLWQPDRNWGYVKYQSGEEVLAQYEAFVDQLIPTVRDGVSAAVYTQTTDVEIEVNGLMTYDRKVVKMDEDRLRKANRRVIEALR